MVISFNTLRTVIKALPKLEGSAGTLKLGTKQIEQIASRDSAQIGEFLQQAVHGVKNPTMEIAYKAKSNYAIAGLRVKEGEKVVRQGAISLSPEGSSQVGKYHLSGSEGDILSGNFRYAADTGKKAVKAEKQSLDGKISYKEFNKKPVDKTVTEEIPNKQVIPGVPRPTITKVVINEKEVLNDLNKYAKTDRVKFEIERKRLNQYGWQVYFDPRTGKLGLMKAKNMEEVAAKLMGKTPMKMNANAKARYDAIKNAEYNPQKMHEYKQQELTEAFQNFEDKVPLNKREWLEILHQNVDDIVNARFI